MDRLSEYHRSIILNSSSNIESDTGPILIRRMPVNTKERIWSIYNRDSIVL